MTVELTILLVAGLLSVGAVVASLLIARSRSADDPEDAVSDQVAAVHRDLLSRDEAIRLSVSQIGARVDAMKSDLASREAVLGEQVSNLDARMTGISNIFSNDRARGGWGEISLRRVLELGGLVSGRDFTEQTRSGGGQPDVVVHLPGGSAIVIDAKFPLARYQEAMAASDVESRTRLLVAQGKELARVGIDLANRGYGDLTTGGYVVMYLPSQAVFELACEANADVVESLMGHKVVVAGPTSLFALLSTAGALLTQHRALRDAEQLLGSVSELNRRLGTWVGHLSKIGSSLVGAVSAYNAAIGSWTSRVQPQLSRVCEDSGIVETDQIPHVDEVVREVPDEGLRVVG